MPLIGAHISVAGGLAKAFPRADEASCESIQIFTRNQRQWQTKVLSMQEIEAFYRAWEQSGVQAVVSHASYLVNLCGSGDIRKKSEKGLIAEIERCHQLGINDIILHPGFAGDFSHDAAIEMIAESLLRAIDETQEMRVRILLETMAGQGTVVGGELRDLEDILNRVNWHKRIGACVDMCHIFASGYEVRSAEAYNRFIDALDKHVTIERVGCWHLSDSKTEKGGKKDRHAHIGQGEIGLTAFSMLMNDERFADVPAVLETPKEGWGDAGNLSVLRKLRGG